MLNTISTSSADAEIERFDLILLSDLVFNHSQHGALLDSCLACLSLPSSSPPLSAESTSTSASTDDPDQTQLSIDLSSPSFSPPALLCFYSHHRPTPELIAADLRFLSLAQEKGWTVKKVWEDANAGVSLSLSSFLSPPGYCSPLTLSSSSYCLAGIPARWRRYWHSEYGARMESDERIVLPFFEIYFIYLLFSTFGRGTLRPIILNWASGEKGGNEQNSERNDAKNKGEGGKEKEKKRRKEKKLWYREGAISISSKTIESFFKTEGGGLNYIFSNFVGSNGKNRELVSRRKKKNKRGKLTSRFPSFNSKAHLVHHEM